MSQTTTTPNYGLIKPNVNADNDLWGDHLNSDMDIIDTKLKAVENKAGVVSFNTRSGTVSLLQADVTTVLPPGAGTPAMDGTASAGTLLTWSKSDHIHPTDTSRYAASNPAGYVTAGGAATAAPVQSVATRTGAVVLTHNDLTDWAATLAPYAPLASPALTGSPTAPTVTPTTDASTKLATTAFVQSALGAVPGGAIVSATPPTANPGALWFDSVGGQTYCRFDDGNTVQWVPVSNITGLANAAQLSDVAPSYNNVGRNLIHNSMFNIAQRGAGPWTVGGYTLDRWQLFFQGADTDSITQVALSDTDRTQIGDEAAMRGLQDVFVGNSGTTSYSLLLHKIEDVRRISGKTVIVSFWAKATVGTPMLGVHPTQIFGSGGAPSASVDVTAQTTPALSATWQRYSFSFAMPTVSGKTFGTTAGTDFTQLAIALSSGATSQVVVGVGVQSGTIQLWGIQLEIAQPGQTQPTPLEKPDPELQLRQCQRFFYAGGFASYGGAVSGAAFQVMIPLPASMRAAPTFTSNFTASAGITSPALAAHPNTTSLIMGTGTQSSTSYSFAGNFTASADL